MVDCSHPCCIFLYWDLSCGLKLPGTTITVRYSAYTDDVSVHVTSSVEVKEVNKETRKYEGLSMVKIKREKSMAFKLGSWKSCALSSSFS